jgi:hypothetical protein
MKTYKTEISKRFEQLVDERDPFLRRARTASRYTLPMIVREDADDGQTNQRSQWNSLGARGVNNLASNFMLSLFPANSPFFKLLVSEEAYEEFGEQAAQIKDEVEGNLARMEKTVLESIEDLNLRPIIFEALINLIISGNTLIYVEPSGGIRNYTIEDYVCHRDMSGNATDIIIQETISRTVADSLGIRLPSDDIDTEGVDREVKIYTCAKLNDEGEYEVHQEIEGEVIADTEETYTKETLPWLPLRLSKNTGESYGRSYCEKVIGDLKTLEALTQSVVESSAIAAKTLFFVDPSSITNKKDVASAENGDVITGRATDVTTLATNKGADLNAVLLVVQNIEQRLSFAFNLLEGTLPSAGAKTAFEVDKIITGLEKVMAGTYAILADEFMARLVKIFISRLAADEKIPPLPEQVKLIISTGMSNLGRSSDLQRLQQFASIGQQLFPQAFAEEVDQAKMANQFAKAIGVDVMKSPEQKQQEAQARQQQQQMQMQVAKSQMELEQENVEVDQQIKNSAVQAQIPKG